MRKNLLLDKWKKNQACMDLFMIPLSKQKVLIMILLL